MVGPPAGEDPVLAAIGGGKARYRLHAVHPAGPGEEGAASGFALALLLALSPPGAPLLWVQDRQGAGEAGEPYGPGLARLGLDPARLLLVATSNAMDALAAAEMGLESAGLAGVLVELPRRLPAGMLRLSKRLSLRAEAQGVPCLLLHATAEAVEAPVATRWQVGSRPVMAARHHAAAGEIARRSTAGLFLPSLDDARLPSPLAEEGAGGVPATVACRAPPPSPALPPSRGEAVPRSEASPGFCRALEDAEAAGAAPAFDLHLAKNRFGPLGRWSVRWQAAGGSDPENPADAGARASRTAAPASPPEVPRHALRPHRPRFIALGALGAPLAEPGRPPHPRPLAALPADRPAAATVHPLPRSAA
jgi:hypothetical protein